MKLADVSVKRPVFAIMMTAALIVLGAFSYRELGLDLMPKTDVPVVIGQAQPARRERRGDRDADHQAHRRGRQHDQRHRRAARHLRPGQLARQDHLHARARHRDRRRRTSATRSRTIVSQFPRDTRPPVIQKIDPDAAPILTLRRVRAARRRRSSPRSPTSSIKQDLETVKDVGAVTFNGERQREIQLLLNADRLNAYGLTVDQVRNAVAAPERRDPGRQLHRRARRDRAPHDGPHQERRGLQPHHPRLPATDRSSRFGDVGRVLDTVQEIRSAARLDGTPAISLHDPQAVGHQHRRRRRPRAGAARADPARRCRPTSRSSDPRPVALHPPVVRGHQAAPDPRRPARQPRRLPVHPEPARHVHRRAGDSDLDHRHVHGHEGVRLHAEQHDDARAVARDRHRHRRRDRRAREHLPVRRGEGRDAEGGGGRGDRRKSAWPSWRRRCRSSSSSCRSRS